MLLQAKLVRAAKDNSIVLQFTQAYFNKTKPFGDSNWTTTTHVIGCDE